MNDNSRRPTLLLLMPGAGIILFILLYTIATFLYPGGSKVEQSATGFNWLHNYWCELTDVYSINGQPNSARPLALMAMVILCISLSIFWYFLPMLFPAHPVYKIIRYSGIMSMGIGVFMFTGYHDLVIDIGGLLAAIALTATFVGLYQSKMYSFFTYGLACLLLMLFNYIIHKTGIFLSCLAVFQKITFVIVAIWIVLVNAQLYRKIVQQHILQ